jgi:hypothetical protein
MEVELDKVEVSEGGKEILANVLWLRGGDAEDEEEGVGRDVRNL